jgi:phosphohistidine phosphatase
VKTLCVVRHAKSSWDDPHLPDHDRPLNKRGLRDAPFMARLAAETYGTPSRILTSTALRALTTARHFASAFRMEERDVHVLSALYPGVLHNYLQVIGTQPEHLESLWLFGHNPGVSQLAQYLVGPAVGHMPTCAIVVAELNIQSWQELYQGEGKLTALHYPKQHFPKDAQDD